MYVTVVVSAWFQVSGGCYDSAVKTFCMNLREESKDWINTGIKFSTFPNKWSPKVGEKSYL